MVAFNLLGSTCCWFSLSIIVSWIVYKMSLRKWPNTRRGIWLSIFIFLFLVVGLPSIVQLGEYIKSGGWRTYSDEDVVGRWTATFNDYGCWQFSGSEILTMNADGTYTQVFKDGGGRQEVVAKDDWEWREEYELVLHNAKALPYYFADSCESNARNKLPLLVEQDGRRRNLNIIIVKLSQVALETDPVGDPDAPQTTQFYRTD